MRSTIRIPRVHRVSVAGASLARVNERHDNMRYGIALGCIIASSGLGACAGESDEISTTSQAFTEGALSANVTISNDWGAGYCAEVRLENGGTQPISGWEVTLDFNGSQVGNLWNGTQSGNLVGPVDHNGTISPGSTTSFGFCASGTGRAMVTALSFDGGGDVDDDEPSCSDGEQNQGETGVDCGGPCAGCAPEESCSDGVQNQGEAGVDCGGPCQACAPTATCSDGVQNQGETGVDCGGPCSSCSTMGGGGCDGLQSWVSNDWQLKIAAGEVIEHQGDRYQANVAIDYPNSACAPDSPAGWCQNWFTFLGPCGSGTTATCSDGVQNQGETGVDCGGPCQACAPTATCSDGMQNQGETGVDCGGPCQACAPTATCSDGVQNQGETGVDCGGPCQACETFECNGFATRYWDCCMPHCGWDANVPMSIDPANVCDVNDQPLSNSQASNGCFGGNAFQCHNYSPWAVSSNLAYGYAAVPGGDICGRCYEVEFTGQGHHWSDPGSAALGGKKMVVQALNIGGDVASGQFDLLIPGGGVGAFNGCSQQWGVSSSELGAQYGGFLTSCRDQGGSHEQVKSCVLDKCQSVFGDRGLTELQAGCEWFVEWFEAADNPNLRYREVSCPVALSGRSGMARSGGGQNACF